MDNVRGRTGGDSVIRYVFAQFLPNCNFEYRMPIAALSRCLWVLASFYFSVSSYSIVWVDYSCCFSSVAHFVLVHLFSNMLITLA